MREAFSSRAGFLGASVLAPLPGCGLPWAADPVVSLCSTTGYWLRCLRHHAGLVSASCWASFGSVLGWLRERVGLASGACWAGVGIMLGWLRERAGLASGVCWAGFGSVLGWLRDCRRARSPGALWRGILTARGTRLTGDLEAARENAARRVLRVARAPWLGVDARF